MINYKKLMSYNPTRYGILINSEGQTIEFVEHPTQGDGAQVICVCHELELAEYSTFYEINDMTADHKEYEPSFFEGDLYIGTFKASD